MQSELIRKRPGPDKPLPNLAEYDGYRKTFTWSGAERELSRLPGTGGLNIAYECVDRHVTSGNGDRIALRSLAEGRAPTEFSYRTLAGLSSRFAAALAELGVQKGERIFTLLGRTPELFISALGTWKQGAVLTPLFSAFGPEPIKARMMIAQPSVLVTTKWLYDRKIAPIRADLPFLRHVILAGGGDGGECFQSLIDRASPDFPIAQTVADDLALIHFTSGTTGRPKGAMHVHGAIVAHHVTAKLALDLHPDDIYWCTADPGWVTGTSYGIIGPLSVGCTMITDEEEFDAERWYTILAKQKVSVWYTAPTAIRMLMRAGPELPRRFDLTNLRFIASVGEPLNPEAVTWSQRVLGLPIHDNWWQTETGGIMISNFASMDIKPGSMGRPLPGIEAAVVQRAGDHVTVIAEPGLEGELALKSGWPSMMRGYLNEDERFRACFADGWYLTGDLARRDSDGYFWFIGRADDVIKSSGHLIGPFEVESALMEHPAVSEAGVIGMPDPIAGEVVKAYVSLHAGYVESETLRKDILAYARRRLGPAIAPRDIAFSTDLPKTRSGKIMRRLLKARELGLPEGDTSTLEGTR
jgi:acetyl-CoA synthetase